MCTIMQTCVYVFIELGPARVDALDQVIAFFHPSTRGVLVRVDDPPAAEISWKISVACQITLLPPWLITSKGAAAALLVPRNADSMGPICSPDHIYAIGGDMYIVPTTL